MDSLSFAKTVAEFFEKWIVQATKFILNREFDIKGGYSYPAILRVGESPHHHVAELVGVKLINRLEDYKIEINSIEKVKNTSSFFNPWFDIKNEQETTLLMDKQRNTLSNICLCTKYDKDVFNKKIDFPISKVVIQNTKSEVPLIILPSSDYLLFHNVDLIRSDSFRILFRTISTAFVVKKTTIEVDLVKWLEKNKVISKQLISGRVDILGFNLYCAPSESFARNLSSLTSQQVNEPIIDKFIQTNKTYFKDALGYKDVLSKPRLEIINKEGWDKDYLEPDYLMQKEDGNYDILDLKKGLLKSKSITLGGKSRCRFNSYVTELIAQLKGYERYFADRQNENWALQNKGIKINNPRLIGVVGDHNNFDSHEVETALEQYKDNIVIISYADLVNFLRKRKNFLE